MELDILTRHLSGDIPSKKNKAIWDITTVFHVRIKHKEVTGSK